jgi:general secretion pathway protein L
LVQPAQSLIQAAQSEWDLAQFDLAATGSARWVKAWVRLQQALWQSPAWRPARWGVAVLLLCQVLGLNAWAWKLQSDLHSRQSDLVQIMKQTFPDIQVVVDAPLQMAREVQGCAKLRGKPRVTGSNLCSLRWVRHCLLGKPSLPSIFNRVNCASKI